MTLSAKLFRVYLLSAILMASVCVYLLLPYEAYKDFFTPKYTLAESVILAALIGVIVLAWTLGLLVTGWHYLWRAIRRQSTRKREGDA